MKSYDLGSEKIGRLVRHFAVPCVISMLVAVLYNIVDHYRVEHRGCGSASLMRNRTGNRKPHGGKIEVQSARNERGETCVCFAVVM